MNQSILDRYFDEHTMSVHLIQDEYPLAKKGRPGEWQMSAISDKKLTEDERGLLITNKRSEIKNKVFRTFGFRYKPTKHRLPRIK